MKISKLLFLFLFLFSQNLSVAETKPSCVDGAFYPQDKIELTKQIEEFLNKANPEKIDGNILGLISPHAGYIYSGQVAAFGYKAVQDKNYDLVVILAPSHYADFNGFSVGLWDYFHTPVGDVAVDLDFCKKLIELNPKVSFNKDAFEKEHSLEVQIPFLQTVLKSSNFKIVPVVFGSFDLSDCQILANSLKILAQGKSVLLIASTDLSHYHPQKEASLLDRSTLFYIENLDAKGLFRAASARTVELCGLGPVLTLLCFVKENNLSAKILKYANSGDVAGDYMQVVGYASVIFYEPTATEYLANIEKTQGGKMLSLEQKKQLLQIARQSIKTYLEKKEHFKPQTNDSALLEKYGAFVTLTKNGDLRGCIGRIVGDMPLIEVIAGMAIEAVVGDPRFTPVTKDELDKLEIEISVLSPLKKIDDVNLIEVGIHGLLIRKGFNSGLLLPQVATEYGWDRITFLEETCHKAGLESNAWRKGADIYIFSAEVFSETDTK